MTDDNHILLAYSFDGKGGGKKLSPKQIGKEIKNKNLAWVHFDANNQNTHKWIEDNTKYLDPFIANALLADETRPRMTQINDGVLIILRGVNLNENSDPEDMVSIRLWIDNNRIISVRRRKLKAVSDLEEKINLSKGPKNAGDFICMLSARLFERMESSLTSLDESIDDIEEKMLEKADSKLREEIVNIRKQAILFRKYMAPQRDAIGQLRTCETSWLNNNHQRHLHEIYNHVIRYVEDLDTTRERAQIVKDELANILADNLNKNMYLLSVIAAIFLPLGFFTGLLGINVGGIPGTEDPSAFWIVVSSMVIILIIQIAIFKKLKWF